MNVKRILNDIQEKIAIDKFKIEIKKNRCQKKALLITASVVIGIATMLFKTTKNSDENYI